MYELVTTANTLLYFMSLPILLVAAPVGCITKRKQLRKVIGILFLTIACLLTIGFVTAWYLRPI